MRLIRSQHSEDKKKIKGGTYHLLNSQGGRRYGNNNKQAGADSAQTRTGTEFYMV